MLKWPQAPMFNWPVVMHWLLGTVCGCVCCRRHAVQLEEGDTGTLQPVYQTTYLPWVTFMNRLGESLVYISQIKLYKQIPNYKALNQFICIYYIYTICQNIFYTLSLPQWLICDHSTNWLYIYIYIYIYIIYILYVFFKYIKYKTFISIQCHYIKWLSVKIKYKY